MRRSGQAARPDVRRSPQRLRPAQTEPARRPPRRTQESRSKAAREKLLRATIELLQERGYAGLTTKEVATRAGFSNGALMHHFSTKADLVIAAGAYIYERHIAEGRKAANSAAARANPLKAFIADCENVYLGNSFIPTTEMMVAARSDPLMNAPFDVFMDDYRKTMNDIWLKAFMRAGYSEADASFTIMSTLFIIRGMAINSIWQKNLPYYRRVLREWAKIERAGALRGARVPVR